VLVVCPNCNSALPDWLLRTSRIDTLCPACFKHISVDLFPALFRTRDVLETGTLTASDGEATCFEHPAKRAVAVCTQCGRFLCSLCEVDLHGETWCPACLESGKSKTKLTSLETHRTLYDSIALALALLPTLLFFYPSVITAPIVLFISIRYWTRPSSLIPRNKWRFVVASIIALVQITGIAFIIYSVVALRPKMR
jgi:hypothetical protein